MAQPNMFALLGDDDGVPTPVVAKPAEAAKKPAGNGKASNAGNSNANKSNNSNGNKGGNRDGARSGGKGGGRGGGKTYEAGDDQTFDNNNSRSKGGKGGNRGRRDGEGGGNRRDFDRHVSRNGQGREGEKRGGAGKANWGTEGDTGSDEKVVKDKEEEEAPKEVEPEEPDNEMTLEQFQAQQAEVLARINVNTKDNANIDEKKLSKFAIKEDDDDEFSADVMTKKGKKNKARKEVQTLVGNFKTNAPTDSREGGKGKGGKGKGGGKGSSKGSGGGGGGKGGGKAMTERIDDASAFPTLGGK